MNRSKKIYTMLLAVVFVGIGSWKLYQFFYTSDKPEMYQIALAGFLIILGIVQLYRAMVVKEVD